MDLERNVTDDPVFIDFVKQNIREGIDARASRPKPKEGFHYRRDWYDRLDDMGGVNSEFFLNNINAVWLKKSSLSSEIRAVLLEVCNRAVGQTLEYYHSQSEMKIVK